MRALLLAACLLLFGSQALAATYVWDGLGTSGDFAASTSLNDAIGGTLAPGDSILVKAGSYTWDGSGTYPSVTLPAAFGGAFDVGANITIAAESGSGTVVFSSASTSPWFFANNTYGSQATGWTVDGIDFVAETASSTGMDLEFFQDWTFKNCTWSTSGEGSDDWLRFVSFGEYGQSNAANRETTGTEFIDCTFSNENGDTADLFPIETFVNDMTFTRCTFDFSAMGTLTSGTLIELPGMHDWLFENCTFIAPATINGAIFGVVAKAGKGGTQKPATTNQSGNIDFLNCSFQGPTSHTADSWVDVKFTNGADSCDVIGSTFTSSITDVGFSALKWEDAEATNGYVEGGYAIGNTFTNYWLSILFGEKSRNNVAYGNKIRGAGALAKGIWFQDGRFNVATNNYIEFCADGAFRFSYGDDSDGVGPDYAANYGNVVTGNYVSNCNYVFNRTADCFGTASCDSATVRGGNIGFNVTNWASNEGANNTLAQWRSATVDGLDAFYEGWVNGLGSIEEDTYPGLLGKLRSYGGAPPIRKLGVQGKGLGN